MEKIEKLAKALHVETWVLIHPTLGANCLSEKDIATYQKVRRAFES